MADVSHTLSPDTQAILLLCAGLGSEKAEVMQPLTLTEYNKLAQWLRIQEMRPGDLLESVGISKLQEAGEQDLDVKRILYLLGRGGALALQVESWTNQGLWILSRSDDAYPQRLKDRLKHRSPAILYGAGDPDLLSYGGLAIVGSRNADDTSLNFTQRIAHRCSAAGIQVISGGARGIDQTAMLSALDAGGKVVGILADSLAKASVSAKYREALREEQLVLISPYAPHAGFNVGNAMGRNKLVYALADWALVVSVSAKKGGTWAGAIEDLKYRWTPVFVRIGSDAPPTNQHLLKEGALSLDSESLDATGSSLRDALDQLQSEWDTHQEQVKLIGLFDQTPNNEKPAAQNVPVAAPASPLQTVDPDSFWNLIIWPLMFRLVAQFTSVDKSSLSAALGIKTAQADEWLKRAVEEGKLKKLIRPVRYTFPEEGQMSLLDEG